MKKILQNKFVIAGIALAIVIASVFYFSTGKGAKNITTSINPAFGEYISAYTAGTVSSSSPIRVSLSRDVVDSSSVGQEASLSLFDFDPSVKGKTVWLDKRTVEFRPASRLVSGQIYQVGFKLSKVMQVSSDLNTFEYSFQVVPQNFELTIDNVKPYTKTELKRQKIEGTLVTADFAEGAAVEKMMTAKQDDNTLRISWTHTSDGKQHLFIVEDVARKETASKVNVSVNGSALSIEQKEDRVVEVFALGDFK